MTKETVEPEVQTEPAKVTVYQKIAQIMSELEVIDKTGWNDFSKYNFVKASSVVTVLREQLVKQKMIIMPEVTSFEVIAKDKGCKVVMNMRFTLMDTESGEAISLVWSGEADDTSDKAMNKAGTAGMKYFLLKLFFIRDESSDPDAESPAIGDKLKEAEMTAIMGLVNDIQTAENLESLTEVGKGIAKAAEAGTLNKKQTDYLQGIYINRKKELEK